MTDAEPRILVFNNKITIPLFTRESSAEILEELSEFKGRAFRQNLTNDMLARLATEIEQ
jgi:hypothetical protein